MYMSSKSRVVSVLCHCRKPFFYCQVRYILYISNILARKQLRCDGVINECFSKSGILPLVSDSSIIILNKGAIYNSC